jgi:hypothetical protein
MLCSGLINRCQLNFGQCLREPAPIVRLVFFSRQAARKFPTQPLGSWAVTANLLFRPASKGSMTQLHFATDNADAVFNGTAVS